jgi:hypothetical protein
MREELERRAAKNEQTVLEYAVEWLENGHTLVELAQDMNKRLGTDEDYVTRSMISRYLNNELEGSQELEEARRGEGAHGMAEGAITVIDEPAESREEIARNKNRAELRLRLAGFMNPTYRDQRGTNINLQVNNGQLHLDAMRQRALTPAQAQPVLPPASAEGADYTFDTGRDP